MGMLQKYVHIIYSWKGILSAFKVKDGVGFSFPFKQQTNECSLKNEGKAKWLSSLQYTQTTFAP